MSGRRVPPGGYIGLARCTYLCLWSRAGGCGWPPSGKRPALPGRMGGITEFQFWFIALSLWEGVAVCGFVDNFLTGEIVACPHESSFHVRFDCAAIQPHDAGVSFSGQAVIGGKIFITESRGGGITYVSRGADCTVRDGRAKSWVGKVRSVVAAGAAGRRPIRKKTQTRMFAFFSSSRPPATAGGCPSPFEPWKDGFATGA
jgi:hypothetical protein